MGKCALTSPIIESWCMQRKASDESCYLLERKKQLVIKILSVAMKAEGKGSVACSYL